jgi:hypothetical protein
MASDWLHRQAVSSPVLTAYLFSVFWQVERSHKWPDALPVTEDTLLWSSPSTLVNAAKYSAGPFGLQDLIISELSFWGLRIHWMWHCVVGSVLLTLWRTLKMKALWCFEIMGTTCQLTEHSTPEEWNLWGKWHIPTSTHISSPNKLSAVWQIVGFLSSYLQRAFKISKCEFTCTNLHRNRWFWQVMAVAMCQCCRGRF